VIRSRKQRLDQALVERGHFEDVAKAARAVMAGQVFVNNMPATKAGMPVIADDSLSLAKREKFVGRGGLKLEAALENFRVNPEGKVCLDVGSSTGGFTDCLLQAGASLVYAIDVGRNQLDWRLRQDSRVISREGVNARFLQAADFDPVPALAVGDVSFISLTTILPAVFGVLESGSELVFLVKPQFEAPREAVGAGGIVRDSSARLACVQKVREFVEAAGQQWLGVMESPITGREGNIEYLAHIRLVRTM
jgi:23S rRNA (cytidine1920-2'-O)/16S rRNA (cytidine1409-2'-O)-methyltransferase